ncbi:MAG: NAD(P)-dependent oxidoreductase [Lachnospiraceae bacterium]|nr:NAD(P)-dependent oxidoreductase [Lachnospiraceae bacterium]
MKYNMMYRDDMKRVREFIVNRNELGNSSLFITGATGLIGSAIVDQLIDMNDTDDMSMKIYIGVRSLKRAEESFGALSERKDIIPVEYDALKPVGLAEPVDYIIHAGSPGTPGEFSDHPVETMMANILGVQNLFKYAGEYGAKRLLFISSSEVYGNMEGNEPFSEEDCGTFDILSPRSCYPSAKRAAETLCASYIREYGADAVIARPGHIYGPTASPYDNRVSSAFMYDALDKRPLVLKSDGSQVRSYCYAVDCASAILTVLLAGQTAGAYNIANKASNISIRALAQIIAECGQTELRFETADNKEKANFNAMKRSCLDAKKLEALGWKPVFDAETGIRHTLDILRDRHKDE